MRKIFKMALCAMLLLSILLSLCGCSDKSYKQYNVGENFGHNIDGHMKRLPKNYCMQVDLGSRTKVFIVPTNKTGLPFFEYSVYLERSVLEAHYIKGWFNDSYLVLCEEKTDSSYVYLSLEFDTKNITYYENEESVYNEFNFVEDDWFSLCNTYKEINH